MRMLFTFRSPFVAAQCDLTHLGPVTGGTPDGMQVIVEPEREDWTLETVHELLIAFGLGQEVLVTSVPDYLQECG